MPDQPVETPTDPTVTLDEIAKPWRDRCEHAQDDYVLAMEVRDRVGDSAHRDELRASLRLGRYAEIVNAIDRLQADEAAWAMLDAQRATRGES